MPLTFGSVRTGMLVAFRSIRAGMLVTFRSIRAGMLVTFRSIRAGMLVTFRSIRRNNDRPPLVLKQRHLALDVERYAVLGKKLAREPLELTRCEPRNGSNNRMSILNWFEGRDATTLGKHRF